MFLTKALKYKNRLVEQLRKVDDDLQVYNSIVTTGEEGCREVDVLALVDKKSALTEELINLKLAISNANQKIQRHIFEMAEIKAQIVFWGGLNTTHGLKSNYMDEVTKYDAVIRKSEVDEKVKNLTEKLDRLQEEVDKHNYITEI